MRAGQRLALPVYERASDASCRTAVLGCTLSRESDASDARVVLIRVIQLGGEDDQKSIGVSWFGGGG